MNDDKFEFDIDDEFEDEFDPFEGAADEEEEFDENALGAVEGSTEFMPPDPGAFAAAEGATMPADKNDGRPASERINELFGQMLTRRKTLLGILALCEEPKSDDEIRDTVAQLEASNYSVYTSQRLCGMLENAGALACVYADGSEYLPEPLEPETVIVDGVAYMKPVDPPLPYWQTTPEGEEYMEADKPLERYHTMIAQEPELTHIYKRILEMCNTRHGVTIGTLNEEISDDPAIARQSVHFEASRFIDRLRDCDALEWIRPTWRTTDIGKTALAELEALDNETGNEHEGA